MLGDLQKKLHNCSLCSFGICLFPGLFDRLWKRGRKVSRRRQKSQVARQMAKPHLLCSEGGINVSRNYVNVWKNVGTYCFFWFYFYVYFNFNLSVIFFPFRSVRGKTGLTSSRPQLILRIIKAMKKINTYILLYKYHSIISSIMILETACGLIPHALYSILFLNDENKRL